MPKSSPLSNRYSLEAIETEDDARNAGNATRTGVHPYFMNEAKSGRGAQFFSLDRDSVPVAIVAVLPEGQAWRTGNQLNQRVHVSGIHNEDPFPEHGAALAEVGRSVLGIDLTYEQAYWYQKTAKPGVAAKAADPARSSPADDGGMRPG